MAERQRRKNGEEPEHSISELAGFARNVRGLGQRLQEAAAIVIACDSVRAEHDRLEMDNTTLRDANATLLTSVQAQETRLAELDTTIEKELRDARARHREQLEADAQKEVAGIRADAEEQAVQIAAGLVRARDAAESEKLAYSTGLETLQRQHQELQHTVAVLQQTRDSLRREVVAEVS